MIKNDATKPAPQPEPLQERKAYKAYSAPQLTPLGAWQSVTLVFSVPIGPGGAGIRSGQNQ